MELRRVSARARKVLATVILGGVLLVGGLEQAMPADTSEFSVPMKVTSS